MPFPLPIDPDFRREVVKMWLQDVEDRLKMGDSLGAKQSWKIANSIYLSLPSGGGEFLLEKILIETRVKLDSHCFL